MCPMLSYLNQLISSFYVNKTTTEHYKLDGGLASLIYTLSTDTSMFTAQIVNILLVLSLSPVNESAATEPRGLWPGQLLCGWLRDGQNAQKCSAALLMWRRFSAVKSCWFPALSSWAELMAERTNFLSTKSGWIRAHWWLKKWLQHERLWIQVVQISLTIVVIAC